MQSELQNKNYLITGWVSSPCAYWVVNVWNSLPDSLHLSRDDFRGLLRTNFFTLYWSI